MDQLGESIRKLILAGIGAAAVTKEKSESILRDLVKNKRYITIYLSLAGESFPHGNSSNTVKLEDCWIELEGVDLSVEDGATLVRPSGTIHANWVGWCDDETFDAGLSL